MSAAGKPDSVMTYVASEIHRGRLLQRFLKTKTASDGLPAVGVDVAWLASTQLPVELVELMPDSSPEVNDSIWSRVVLNGSRSGVVAHAEFTVGLHSPPLYTRETSCCSYNPL